MAWGPSPTVSFASDVLTFYSQEIERARGSPEATTPSTTPRSSAQLFCFQGCPGCDPGKVTRPTVPSPTLIHLRAPASSSLHYTDSPLFFSDGLTPKNMQETYKTKANLYLAFVYLSAQFPQSISNDTAVCCLPELHT